jgi:ribonuclease P protein component
MDCSFRPAQRLHDGRDYSRVFDQRRKSAGPHVVVLVRPLPRGQQREVVPEGRLGVMVPAKAVRLAVRRHQLKRWVRELFRTRLKQQLAGHDMVVLFRRDPPEDGHAQLDMEISDHATRALAQQRSEAPRGERASERKR